VFVVARGAKAVADAKKRAARENFMTNVVDLNDQTTLKR
jgi:hypothetical protein